MGEIDFLAFAEDDYNTFKEMYKANITGNAMGYIAEQACEKYLKHIICLATNTTDYNRVPVPQSTLHNLKQMCFYIRDELKIPVGYTFRQSMGDIQRYYKDTRYPGYTNSHIITKNEIEDCACALTDCRKFTMSYVQQIKQQRDQDHQNPFENDYPQD